MTTRILPPDEWVRLAETELGPVWRLLDPMMTRIVVVEDEGAIVGCWAAIRVVHAEGLWVRDDHRKSRQVAQGLMSGMEALARSWGAKTVATASVTPEMTRFIEHHGGERLPGEHFTIPLESLAMRH